MSEIGLEPLLRRDRVIVVAALVVVIALAWIYILRLAAGMDMGGMDMTGFRMVSTGLDMVMAPAQAPWSATEFALTFAMWTVMMIGMMTPSAAPMILIYARAGRMASAAGSPLAATGWFVAAYLAVWTGFALAATTAQFALGRFALLDPALASASNVLGGALLVVAGLYQWTPLKHALPVAMPVAAPVHRAAWRFPQQHHRSAAARWRSRALSPGLLLGPDGDFCLSAAS